MTHAWMSYPGVANPAEIPLAAVEAWREIGWSECEPPRSADPTLVEYVAPHQTVSEISEDDTSESEED